MATATRTSTRLSTTEFAVLGMLSWGEHSGYELKKIAEAGVGYLWTAAKSHVYAVLPNLVRGGFATTRRVSQSRRPDKQLYRITKKGREAFREWLKEPVEEPVGTRSPFLLKLFFGDQMSKETVIAHVERRREAAAAELAEYREIEKRIKGVEQNYFGYVTLRWGLAQSRAWIRWADEILRELEERP